MKTESQGQFATRYHAALQSYLEKKPAAARSSRSAQLLGRDALSLGLDTLDLARVHDQSLHALVSSQPLANGRNGNGRLTQAGTFLIEALTPVEKTHRAAQTTASKVNMLRDSARERTVKLRAAEKQSRIEVALRKATERMLIKESQRCNQLVNESMEMASQLRHLARQVLSAQEEERKEISRELHDQVAQILAGINVRLAALSESAGKSSRSLQQSIARTQRLVEKSVIVVHRYARDLRPSMLDDLGLIPALRSYIKELTGRKKLNVILQAAHQVEKLDNASRTALFRVIQEALTNVIRHARANTVKITIEEVNGSIRTEIFDDGRSFSPDRLSASKARKQLGIISMRERVEMVGGTFTILPEPGKGTLVRAVVPLTGKKPDAKA